MSIVEKMRVRTAIYRWFFAVAGLLLTVGCTEEATVTRSAEMPAAVGFAPYMQQSREGNTTRGDRREQREALAATRADDAALAELKKTGFTVFACHHGADDYDTEGTTGTQAFNFMYNERLQWNSTDSRWEYSPVKYWPNGTDEQNAAGSPSNTATESGTQKVSFFAIAPYFEYKSTSEEKKATYPTCITDLTASSVASASSYVEYTAAPQPGVGTDLLWADNVNLYKQKASGEGLVDGRVQMPFVHALTQLGVTVQARVDESDGYNSDAYSDDVDSRTRILIDEVTISGLTDKAKLMLTSKTAEPRWTEATTSDVTIDGNGDGTSQGTVAAALSNSYLESSTLKKWAGSTGTGYYLYNSSGTYATTDAAETAFNALPEGVTSTEQALCSESGNFICPPCTLSVVRITYYVVTFDEHLELNTPQYFSIVKNEVSYSPSVALKYNKKYRLRLLLGLTSVKFELLELDEWGETVILSAIVKDWDVETKEYDVE